MKLWLDDVRPAPEGWTRAYTAAEAIDLLKIALNVGDELDDISLDHDLGADPSYGIYARGTSEHCGCEVVEFLFNRRPFVKNPIRIHSWNGEEARKMAWILNEAGYDVEIRPYDPIRFLT